MSDLVGGRYPATYPTAKLLGIKDSNATQGNVGIRSNLEWFGLGNLTDGALAASGVGCAVPVPVEPGDVITTISILVGNAAEATGTHAFAALYSGIATPVLLGQSTDATGATAVGPVNTRFDFALSAPVLITSANAPNGFVYASIAVTATTVPTCAVVATPTTIGYQWFSNGPLFLAATHGSALAGTAPATIASPAAKAVAPLVFLS